LITRYFLPSTSSSSGEYLVKYTISPSLISIAALWPLSNILPAHTATTLPLEGFSLDVSGNTIPEAVFCSCSIASTNIWSSNGINFAISFIFLTYKKLNLIKQKALPFVQC